MLKNGRIGSYTIRGGLSKNIYLASNDSGSEVVIKKVDRYDAVEDGGEACILKEVRRKGVPNTVRLLDCVSESGKFYIVMERIPGNNLDQYVRIGNLNESQVGDLGLQLTETLAALHTDPAILHRDVKPANLILTPYSEVRLIDFGIARRERDPDYQSGTANFMPLEQRLGSSTPKSDIYALGATLYTLLLNRRPTVFNLESVEQENLSVGMIDFIRSATAESEQQRPSATEAGELLKKAGFGLKMQRY